jgi:spore germination cell wall hydrolase CwlJ-like protein
MIGEALICMALNVHHEARGEIFAGQLSVAHVTFRRAKFDPAQVCGVVFRRGPNGTGWFSWTEGLRGPYRKHLGSLVRKAAKSDPQAWERSVALAQNFTAFPDPTGGADHYHRYDIRPYWVHSLVRLSRIGNHVFYKRRAK